MEDVSLAVLELTTVNLSMQLYGEFSPCVKNIPVSEIPAAWLVIFGLKLILVFIKKIALRYSDKISQPELEVLCLKMCIIW